MSKCQQFKPDSFCALGRTVRENDVAGLTIKHLYDDQGFEVALQNYYTGTTYWEARDIDANGRALSEYLGNGVVTTRAYDQATGVLASIQSGVGGGSTLQNQSYGWDSLGNLRFRENTLIAKHEEFKYDEHNRLLNYEVSAGAASYGSAANLDVEPTISANQHAYDIGSNLTTKPGLSNISHTGHRLAAATQNGTAHSYAYDSRGRLKTDTRGGTDHRSITWTSFSQVASITMAEAPRLKDTDGNDIYQAGSSVTSFEFGASLERLRSTKAYTVTAGANLGTVETTVTTYLGSVERMAVTEAPLSGPSTTTVTTKHYVGGFAIVEEKSVDGAPATDHLKYLLKDHLGSPETITDSSGLVLERLSFNAWGQQRDAATWGADPAFNTVTRASTTTRGFTGHEMLDEAGLVHMNGRIYDAALGHFLSADPYVQAPDNPHNFNRYAYVLNNPLSNTDPSGHFFAALFKVAFDVIAAVVTAVGTQTAAFAGAVAAGKFVTAAGIFFGVVKGANAVTTALRVGFSIFNAVNTALNGGQLTDILRAQSISFLQRSASLGLHEFAEAAGEAGDLSKLSLHTARSVVAHTAGHGVVGGLANIAIGGKFQDGFLGGVAGAGASWIPGVGDVLAPEGEVGGRIGIAGRTAIAGVIGGVASAVGGGKFANGAFTAAFQHLFNQEVEYYDLEDGHLSLNSDGVPGYRDPFGNWHRSFCAACHDPETGSLYYHVIRGPNGKWAAVGKMNMLMGPMVVPPAGYTYSAYRLAQLRNLTRQANALVRLNGGRHRVTLRSRLKKFEIDLAGNSHGGVPTPHTKMSVRNFRAPNQPKYNTKSAPTIATTQAEIRMVRNYLLKQLKQ